MAKHKNLMICLFKKKTSSRRVKNDQLACKQKQMASSLHIFGFCGDASILFKYSLMVVLY